MGVFGAFRNFGKAMVTKDTSSMLQAIENWLDAGIIPQSVIANTVLSSFSNTVKKAKKKGATLDEVMKSLESDPKAMKLYTRCGLSREVFEAEAKKILGDNAGK